MRQRGQTNAEKNNIVYTPTTQTIKKNIHKKGKFVRKWQKTWKMILQVQVLPLKNKLFQTIETKGTMLV